MITQLTIIISERESLSLLKKIEIKKNDDFWENWILV